METGKEPNLDAWVSAQLSSLEQPVHWTPDTSLALAHFQRQRQDSRRRRQRWMWTVTAAAAASAGLLAMPSTRTFAARCVDACLAETTRVSQFVWRSVTTSDSDRKPAPDFTLADASGSSVQLSALKGKVVLLNFWATWCFPCLTEIPWFVDYQRSYRDAGLVVLGISLDEDGWRSVKPFLAKHQVNYPVLVGGDQVANLYGGVTALPMTFLIDRHGRIAASHAGLLDRARLEPLLETLLAER